jgi:hypothetical protein
MEVPPEQQPMTSPMALGCGMNTPIEFNWISAASGEAPQIQT